MKEKEFREYLRDERYAESQIDDYCIDASYLEKKFWETMRKDFDGVVSDERLYKEARYAIKHLYKSKADQYKEVLDLYLIFVRETSLEKRMIRRPARTVINEDTEATKNIFYDSRIPKNNPIRKFRDFLENEYEKLVDSDTSDRLLLDRNLPWEGRKDALYIPVIISPARPMKKYHKSEREIIEEIYNAIRDDITKKEEKENSIRKIEAIKNNKEKTVLTLGTYNHVGKTAIRERFFRFEEDGATPVITIYYKNFSYDNREELEAKLANCLAHEYFHFRHDMIAESEFKKNGRNAKRVKESLADFFGMLYSLDRAGIEDIEYAYSEYEAWERCYGTDWPYAYARCYFFNSVECPVSYSKYVDDYQSNGCKELFNKVLKISETSMQEAYEVLTEKAPEPK